MDYKPLRDCLNGLIELGVPGLELVVCRDHQILFHECMGYSDYVCMRAASCEDLYWMYSCTKPVTATAGMQCLEMGLFKLDDPVYEYLPAYRNAYLMKDGERCPVSRPITIRHLMTMSAGLDYNLNTDAIERIQKETGGRITTRQMAEALMEKPLGFEPGTRFEYSLCLDVLGAVIEAASGLTLRDFMKKHIFDPLEMKRTDFWVEEWPAPNLAAIYNYDSEEKKLSPRTHKNNYAFSPNMFSGGAGLVSTALDMAKFTDALACGGANEKGVRILKPESIDLMRTEQLTAMGAAAGFGCTCGADYGYGLGVRTRVRFDHGARSGFGEFGWDGAAGADMLIDPENRLSVAYVQHITGWPGMTGIVHLKVRDALYPMLGLG